MAKKPLIPVTPSSGNVFADIGVPEPEEELAKAQLASRIREIVERPTHELLERTPHAPFDQTRSGRGNRGQIEASTTSARSDPRRSRSPRLIEVRGQTSPLHACTVFALEASSAQWEPSDEVPLHDDCSDIVSVDRRARWDAGTTRRGFVKARSRSRSGEAEGQCPGRLGCVEERGRYDRPRFAVRRGDDSRVELPLAFYGPRRRPPTVFLASVQKQKTAASPSTIGPARSRVDGGSSSGLRDHTP